MSLKIMKKAPPAQGETSKAVVDNKTKQEVSQEAKSEAVTNPTAQALTAEPLCTVEFGSSYTHNLGNYQSAKVHVQLAVPCPPEEIDTAFEYAKTWVEGRMQAEIDALSGDGED